MTNGHKTDISYGYFALWFWWYCVSKSLLTLTFFIFISSIKIGPNIVDISSMISQAFVRSDYFKCYSCLYMHWFLWKHN